MNSNNPIAYKVAKQQLEALRKLAQLSIDIDDPEGLKIIQAAEVAIERRIMDCRLNLSAIEYLEHLIDRGFDFPEAQWRTTQCYPVSAEELQTQYDKIHG